MNHQEQELVWLGRKVQKDEETIANLEHYMDQHERYWSKEVALQFFHMLLSKKDQLYFEQSRLEKLAWKVHYERERRL